MKKSQVAGEIVVLTNVGVFTEGTDLPIASCLLMAQPTRDDSAYMQRLGRVLRTHPGKADALVLDFAPREARDLVTCQTMLWAEGIAPTAEGDDVAAYGVSEKKIKQLNLKPRKIVDPDKVRIKVLDYLKESPLSWHFDGTLATVSLDRDFAIAAFIIRGQWVAFLVRSRGPARPIFTSPEWSEIEAGVRMLRRSRSTLADKGALWRDKEPTEKQIHGIERLGVKVRPGLTRGKAAKIITHAKCQRAIWHEKFDVSVDPAKVPPVINGVALVKQDAGWRAPKPRVTRSQTEKRAREQALRERIEAVLEGKKA